LGPALDRSPLSDCRHRCGGKDTGSDFRSGLP